MSLQGVLNWKKCKVCGRAYDMMSCPYCNTRKIKEKREKDGARDK